MESVWVYIVAGLFFVLRYYLENKNKKEPVPEPEEELEDQETTEEPMTVESVKELIKEMNARQSLAEEFVSSGSYVEGSDRVQHSSQYEFDSPINQANHNIHEDYSGKQVVEDEKPMVEMDAEKMREALIYQTILQRPDF